MDTPTNMRALLCDGPHKYYVKEIPVDYITEKSLKPNELLVKILLVGICGSDIKMYKGAPFYWADNGRVNKKLLPIISGHEFVGEVVDPGTTDFKVGELVVTEQLVVCQSLNRPPCWFCQNGHFNKCDNLSIYGQAMHGALSEYMVYRDARLTYRATGLTANQAVLTEVLAVSVHSVQRVIPHLNDDTLKGMTAVVSGCGSVGLGVIAGLR
jgi:threonine dehydrogenase-like Zn-dependent dehydrogenase